MIKKLWSERPLISAAFLILITVTTYHVLFSPSKEDRPSGQNSAHSEGSGSHEGSHCEGSGSSEPVEVTEDTKWTCSMHPQVLADKPGLCPLCAMDLIPLNPNKSASGPRTLSLSESAMKLADIQTTEVKRMRVSKSIRLVGKVAYDESRIKTITAWIPGRIDKLYADYTGIPVKKGEHLFDLYSPDLLSAQQELIQAIKAYESSKLQENSLLKKTLLGNLESIRNKLRLWGLTPQQITTIEESLTPSDHMTIYAPIGGTIIHKNAEVGKYVDTGVPVYKIADLTQVWLTLEAYESDLPWLRFGQTVEFTSIALPGHSFEGTVVFIDPIVDDSTRSVNIRVNVTNENLLLKPGMLVSANVQSNLAADGQTVVDSLAGKWICPMHGEITKDEKGICDICHMDLETAESLGFRSVSEFELPLVIPQSAPLLTGERAVVYVKQETESPTFEGREVILGPKADGYYIVREGLLEGEEVVTHGNFKIDSAMQILAKPSMMNDDTTEGSHHEGSHSEGSHHQDSSPSFYPEGSHHQDSGPSLPNSPQEKPEGSEGPEGSDSHK